MTDKKKTVELAKIGPDGKEVPYTPEEAEKMMAAIRGFLLGGGKIEFSDEGLASLKRKGMSQEEITSMMAKAFKANH